MTEPAPGAALPSAAQILQIGVLAGIRHALAPKFGAVPSWMLGWKLSASNALVFLVLTIVVASKPSSDVWWPLPLGVALFNGVFAIVDYRGHRRRKNGR